MQRTLEILIVEDNQGDVEMAQWALRKAAQPTRLSVAYDGEKGLDLLRQRVKPGDEPLPDLVLLDMNLPRMDGKAFLDALRGDKALRAIPVIMFTSSQSPADIRASYERGANAYVVKPFDIKTYGQTVGDIVHFWGQVSSPFS